MTAALQIPVGYAPDLAELNRALLAMQAQSAILPITVVPPPTGNAAVDTRHLQDALTRGSYVITWPGEYALNDTLTEYSNTTWFGWGTSLKMAAGAGGKPVVQNAAFANRASAASVTLSWSSGASVPISGWIGAGQVAGNYAYIQGSSLSTFNTVGLLTAADSAAGTATMDLVSTPSGAGSGAITAILCDQNIVNAGITFDYNYPNNTTGTSNLNSCCITFLAVQNYTFRDCVIKNAEKFCLMEAGVRDGTIENTFIPVTNSDGIHTYGPAINVHVRRLGGQTGDDSVVFQTRESPSFPNFVLSNGDILNCSAIGIDMNNTLSGSGIVTCYASSGERMAGIVVDQVTGTTNNGYGVKLFSALSSSDLIESITIGSVNVNGSSQLRIGRSAANALTVQSLKAGVLTENSFDNNSVVFLLDASCVIFDGDIYCQCNNPSFTGGRYLNVILGTYRRLKINGVLVGGSTGRFIQLQAVQTGEIVIGVSQQTGDQVCGGTLVSGIVTFAFSNVSGANCLSPSAMGGAVTVNAVGNIFNNTQLVRAALGTFTVQSGGGNVFQGTATPVFATSSATTPAFTVKGNDLAVDIGGSGMSASRVGQFLLNTGSRGTIAPNKLVISNGVAWVQPDNMGSTFVN